MSQTNEEQENTKVSLDERHLGPLALGELVGERYRVIAVVEIGKSHATYKVEQIYLRQTFALKTLSTPKPSNSALRSFQLEAQCATKLSHPNLAKAIDLGVIGSERPYYVCDLVEGDNLSDYVKREGTFLVDDVLHIFIPVCYALDFAYGEGIVHGNLNPANIILTRGTTRADLVPKVINFRGFQDASTSDTTLQTKVSADELFQKAVYLSPEESIGKKTDQRSDIYSLGCVMYEALTGAAPFHADTAHSLMQKHQSQNAPSLKEASMGRDYPPQLEAVISKALSKDPNLRYQSFLDMANGLSAVRHPEAIKQQVNQSENVLDDRSREKLEKTSSTSESSINWKVIAAFLATNIFSIAMTSILMTNFLHQNSTSEKLSSDERDYINDLATARAMFMTTVGSGQNQRRIFHFPEVSIGTFSYFDPRSARWIDMNAKGEVSLPINCLTKFETEDRFIAERSNTLRLFGPDDITNLIIKGTSISSYEDNLSPIVDAAMAYVSRYRSMTQLSLPGLPVSDVGIRSLQALPNLVAIDVSNSKASIDSIEQLKNFKQLTSLRMDGVADAKHALPLLVGNSNLRILGMGKTNLDDSDLRIIGKMALHILDIRSNPKVTNEGIHALAFNDQLIELHILGVSATPGCIDDLARLKNLHVLTIAVPGWKKEDVIHLQAKLPTGCSLIVGMPDNTSLGFHPIDWQKELH